MCDSCHKYHARRPTLSAASIPPHTTAAAAAELKVIKENTLKFKDKSHPKQQWKNALI